VHKWIFLCIAIGLLSWSCSSEQAPLEEVTVNPFFSEWDTPFGVPPFDEIEEAHYLPAFEKGFAEQSQEVKAIAEAAEAPTFDNTVEALERSGALLTNVSNVFYRAVSANTNDEIQAIAKKVAPMRSKHRDDILLNEKLFQRLTVVYGQRDELELGTEQDRLLEETYKDFVRGGANLDEQDKAALREINKELSLLSVQYGENVLKENNSFELVIDQEEDLAGLPESLVIGAKEAADERGHAGKWVFTLHRPSINPFLQYSEKRELREKIFKGYINRGNNDNELDNKDNAAKIAALRVKRANLLGYETHAHYVLEENMAKNPEGVYDLLNRLWEPSLARAKDEARALQGLIDREGGGFELAAWDWRYYAEKLRKEKYALDDSVLRPYFELDNVIQGAFTVANKLYGITLEERTDIPKYHEDVKVFEVKEADGSHIGILYTDYFPRASKRGGAWSSAFRKQYRLEGENVTPVIVNVGNFSKPTGDNPALLNFTEVNTLFHEFGHALHQLLSDCTYESLSGTSVPRDFVELGSQIMENWTSEPEVLSLYAKHYETGEVIPSELVEKLEEASKFNQGFETVEYLAASFLDMDWHTLNEAEEQDTLKLEEASLNKIGLIPEIVVRYRSPYFNHIFSGGYSAGYYSYIWSEVLDADAFQAFKETSLFDQATAKSFRKNILARGGTEDPMTLYKRFRGAEPRIEPLLVRRGLTGSSQ